jgi:tRNA G26 N,N-dimethylase Trm1
MAVLCASYPETCYAKYSSIPMKGDNSHEAALRIVLSTLESSATKYKRVIKPLLTLSIDFYMRTFVQVIDSPSGSKQACRYIQIFSKVISNFDLVNAIMFQNVFNAACLRISRL